MEKNLKIVKIDSKIQKNVVQPVAPIKRTLVTDQKKIK